MFAHILFASRTYCSSLDNFMAQQKLRFSHLDFFRSCLRVRRPIQITLKVESKKINEVRNLKRTFFLEGSLSKTFPTATQTSEKLPQNTDLNFIFTKRAPLSTSYLKRTSCSYSRGTLGSTSRVLLHSKNGRQ